MKMKPGQRKSSSGRKGVPDRQFWTADDIESAMAMFDDDLGFEDIARALGRSVEATKVRIYLEQYKARIAAGNRRTSVDPSLEAERVRRRDGYDARDLTSTFFGDPPRGFSALDKQRSQ